MTTGYSEDTDPEVANFLQVANALPEAILVTAGDGAILGGNKALTALLCTPLEDLRGKRLPEIATGQGSTAEYLRACARSSQFVPGSLVFFPDSQKIDCRCEGAVLRPRTGDGPALLLLRLKHKADAVQKFLGLNEQITALSKEVHQRKQAQARLEVAVQQKEVLLREVHHRVKNNMQVISALLELHGLDIVDPRARQILQEVRNRIRVIAQVHERLYSNENLEHVHMASFLEQLVPDLFRVYKPAGQDISLVLTLEPVKADMDTAMTCGLLVHELIANALEHAFPRQGISGERSGTVEVALYPADAGEMAVLRISDDGVGLPLGFDLAAAQTVGLQLVSSMTQQLGGSVTVDTANGTTFTITFGG